MTITFACGHVITVTDDKTLPECPHCHETRVTRVAAPAPRFTGTVTGPSARTMELVKEVDDGERLR